VDATKRNRPGVKNVTFGGVELGALISVEGSVKNKPITVQNGRSLSTGVEASVKIVMAQCTKTEVTAALLASTASDTVICNFWGGSRIFKLTNVLAGKAVTIEDGEKETITIEVKAFFPRGSTRVIINTVPGTFELVFLDNVTAP
jgi:UDP-N-acetylglucosamine enolpyruvyl transferase